MKISESWVRSWVNPPIETDELVAKLTMAGLEVDAVEPVAKKFSGVLVAEIVETHPHPDADKLRVCQVNDGTQLLQIVCGAPNARVGIKVPLATVGAILPDDFKIKKAKLRGVESNGMLCAREELGVAGDSAGLWELPSGAPIGEDIREYLELDDKVIDIDLTPNRADCLSVQGIARDIGVFCREAVNYPDIPEVPAETDRTFPIQLSAGAACPVYVGRVVEGVDLTAETPLWMKERLARADIGSIHPAVDVTNYVMLELGQPMHAFDLSQLQGGIEVRLAKPDEKLVLLDEKEVSLDQEVLVIADHAGPLAMAGIMGGINSGVTESTVDIFFESAFFHPLAITGKARNYGLHTDSSHRFERGVDPRLQKKAVERATELLVSIAGGRPGPVAVAQIENELPASAEIELRQSRLEILVGCEFERANVEDILDRLGLEILESDAQGWKVKAPSWRFDLEIEADLIEEVARIYGYDRLPERTLPTTQPIQAHNESCVSSTLYKQQLVSRGFREVINYSFIDPELQRLCFPEISSVAVKNPIAADMSVMRTSLVPGLLKTAAYNLNRQQNDLSIFEAGMVFIPTASAELRQENLVAGLMAGSRLPQLWANESGDVDFYDAKKQVELLLGGNTNDELSFAAGVESPIAHPGQSAKIVKDDLHVGWIARVHPAVQSKLDIDRPVFVFELKQDAICTQPIPEFHSLSRFPGVRRDIALVVDNKIPVGELVSEAQKVCGELLIESRIFDIYHGQGIDSNEKSVGIGLTFRDYSRTLNDEFVTQKVNELVEHLGTSHNARQR